MGGEWRCPVDGGWLGWYMVVGAPLGAELRRRIDWRGGLASRYWVEAETTIGVADEEVGWTNYQQFIVLQLFSLIFVL